MGEGIPSAEMDSNIVGLVKALNTFGGIYTVSSCGGHRNNKSYQLPAGSWEVTFQLVSARQNSPSVGAWYALEFLVYAFSKCFHSDEGDVRIATFSPLPYLNGPGRSLSFTLEGKGVNPDDVAEWLLEFQKEYC